MATFFTPEGKETAKGSQGTGSQELGLRSPSMTTGQVLAAGYSSDYSMDLLDSHTQVRDKEPDKQLENGMFKAFESLVAVSFGYVIFTRRCYKWPFL